MLALIIVGGVLGYFAVGLIAARMHLTNTHNEYKHLQGSIKKVESHDWYGAFSTSTKKDAYELEMNAATKESTWLVPFWPILLLIVGVITFVDGGVRKAVRQDKRNEDAIKFLKNQAKNGTLLERENAKELLVIMEKK